MIAVLQLLRLPTVFTAIPDVLLGYILTHRSLEPTWKVAALVASSAALYLAGMVLNDVFDRQLDATERPDRPIPSGRVRLWQAVALGCGLLLTGLVVSWPVAEFSRVVAVLLVLAILAYNAVLKGTLLGPIGMGLCRGLNVMLGASDWTLQNVGSFVARPQLVVAIGMAVYIVGVTWFARHEAGQSPKRGLIGGLIVVWLGILTLCGLVLTWPNEGKSELVLLLLGFVGTSLTMRVMPALRTPSAEVVQGLVRLMLLNYVMLSAAMVYWHTANGLLALSVALLVVPAMLLSRVIRMT
jgi:hypothetical protein